LTQEHKFIYLKSQQGYKDLIGKRDNVAWIKDTVKEPYSRIPFVVICLQLPPPPSRHLATCYTERGKTK
jgi:hypothetical protein